jgi:hypothetical protein
VGAELGTDAFKPTVINQTLLALGFQEQKIEVNNRGRQVKSWLITEAGTQYGQMQMDTAAGHNKTVFAPRWFSAIVPLLTERLRED